MQYWSHLIATVLLFPLVLSGLRFCSIYKIVYGRCNKRIAYTYVFACFHLLNKKIHNAIFFITNIIKQQPWMHIASIRFYYIPLKTKYFHLTLNITISTWKATHMLSLSVGSSGSNICIWYTTVRFIEHCCICCYVGFLLSINLWYYGIYKCLIFFSYWYR